MFVLDPLLALLALAPVPFVVVDRDALQPALAARPCRRSSSGSPS